MNQYDDVYSAVSQTDEMDEDNGVDAVFDVKEINLSKKDIAQNSHSRVSVASQLEATDEESQPPEFRAQDLIARFKLMQTSKTSEVSLNETGTKTRRRPLGLSIPGTVVINSSNEAERRTSATITSVTKADETFDDVVSNNLDNEPVNSTRPDQSTRSSLSTSSSHLSNERLARGYGEEQDDKCDPEVKIESGIVQRRIQQWKNSEIRDVKHSRAPSSVNHGYSGCDTVDFKLHSNRDLYFEAAVAVNHSVVKYVEPQKSQLSVDRENVNRGPAVSKGGRLIRTVNSEITAEPHTSQLVASQKMQQLEDELPPAGTVKELLQRWNMMLSERQKVCHTLLPGPHVRMRNGWSSGELAVSKEPSAESRQTHDIRFTEDAVDFPFRKIKNVAREKTTAAPALASSPRCNEQEKMAGSACALPINNDTSLPWSGITRNVRNKFDTAEPPTTHVIGLPENSSRAAQEKFNATGQELASGQQSIYLHRSTGLSSPDSVTNVFGDSSEKKFKWSIREVKPLSRPTSVAVKSAHLTYYSSTCTSRVESKPNMRRNQFAPVLSTSITVSSDDDSGQDQTPNDYTSNNVLRNHVKVANAASHEVDELISNAYTKNALAKFRAMERNLPS